ncbi:Retrovirus-related Pol polyprotein, partial [Aphis craccivora]
MRNDEDVNDYCHRVEKLYYKLCTTCTLNKEEAEARARNPKTLEVAKQLAKAEEVEYNSEKENNRYRNEFNNKGNYNFSRQNNNNFQRTNNTRNNNMNGRTRNFQSNNFNKPSYQPRTNNYSEQNNSNRPPIKCYNCNDNHYAPQCRNNSVPNYTNNRNRTSNRNNFTEELIQTIDKISIPIIITNKNIDTEFYVVGMQFPIRKDALQPRTEAVVKIAIADPVVESKSIYIDKQQITKDVYCSSTVSTVNEGKAIVSMLNISEEIKEINITDLNKINYDIEYEIYSVEVKDNYDERITRLREIIRTDHMDENEKKSIYEICEKYNKIFHMGGDILTFTNVGNHIIRLKKDQPPISRWPYRLPHAQQDEINMQIKKLEDNDIIEKSRSPWNSPLLLVRKKIDNSGKQKFRIVVDFRALNEVTINEFHPLPNITEILDQLGQCQLFSVLDLSSGFYQIKLEKESRELTAFSTNQGHWHFKRMIQGMKTSPGTFQRVMNSALAVLVVSIEATYVGTVDEQNNINELNIITTVAFIEATYEMTIIINIVSKPRPVDGDLNVCHQTIKGHDFSST